MKASAFLQDISLLTASQDRATLMENFLKILAKIDGVELTDLYDLHRDDETPRERFNPGNGERRMPTPATCSLSHAVKPGALFTIEENTPFHRALCTHRIVTWRSEASHVVRMILPIRVNEQIRQFLTVETGEHGLPHRGGILYLLRIYRNVLNILEKNDHDSLTGLLNRQAFQRSMRNVIQQIAGSMDRRNRDSHSHFLIMLDLDHFKRINDEHGHLIGDEVLIHFARLLENNFRFTDQKFRYGGEEFALIIQNERESDIEHILERFLQNVRSYRFPSNCRLTTSGGFLKIDPGETTVELVEKADRALYYSKENGRDRISDYNELVNSGKITPAQYTVSDVTLWKQH